MGLMFPFNENLEKQNLGSSKSTFLEIYLFFNSQTDSEVELKIHGRIVHF